MSWQSSHDPQCRDKAGPIELVIEPRARDLGGFEVPKAIRLLDTLPMTSTGKVQKQPLRERYSDLYSG